MCGPKQRISTKICDMHVSGVNSVSAEARKLLEYLTVYSLFYPKMGFQTTYMSAAKIWDQLGSEVNKLSILPHLFTLLISVSPYFISRNSTFPYQGLYRSFYSFFQGVSRFFDEISRAF